MRRTSVVVLAIAVSGCMLELEGEQVDPPPPPPDTESEQFLPQLCTGGLPGDATCPVNQVDLGDLGATGSFAFVAQALGSGLYLNQIRFVAGSEGLYLEKPVIKYWPEGALTPVEYELDVILNIPPETAAPLNGTASFVSQGLGSLSLNFTVIGPYRP